MKAINEAKLEFWSRSANEGFARTTAACFAAQLDPTLDEINDIKTAVSEAVTNCIVHAYPEELGMVKLRLRLYRRAGEIGGTVTVRGTPDQAMKVLRAAGLPKLMRFE